MSIFETALDPASADVRVEFGLAEAEYARQSINRATAAQIAAIHRVLREARETPSIYVGPHARSSNREHVEFAERAAISDLAVRLALAENTVRAYDLQASTMILRTPHTWSAFRRGEVSPANARVVSDLAGGLPDDRDLLARFDELVSGPARTLAPARFGTRARAVRERLHARAAIERHALRAGERRVRFTPDVDGMAWLEAYLPAEIATRAMAHLDEAALKLRANDPELRTMDQLRADTLGELLTGDGTSARVGVRVGVLVPVMTLLGLSEEPATLDGYGPIDAATARRLTAEAPSFYRVLTHPISSTVLDIDRVTLRVPADMKRWLQVRDQVHLPRMRPRCPSLRPRSHDRPPIRRHDPRGQSLALVPKAPSHQTPDGLAGDPGAGRDGRVAKSHRTRARRRSPAVLATERASRALRPQP